MKSNDTCRSMGDQVWTNEYQWMGVPTLKFHVAINGCHMYKM